MLLTKTGKVATDGKTVYRLLGKPRTKKPKLYPMAQKIRLYKKAASWLP